ncbi:hypothetical protein CLV71_126118 [Actinophytocola oryzae]|uniref:Uncharacterized protein n=1 Tax=Actinophytocola oryzae TaxID=502181 RepID=A0A4R7UU67_9PSEU|nr:hypothetical protein CLV71_126118 [Actinophytocola oryzae]
MPASTSDHPLPKHPSKSKRRPKIDLDHPIELLERVIGQLPNPGDPSPGDEHVNVPTLADKPIDVTPHSQVGNDRVPRDVPSENIQHVAPPAGNHELAPLISQPPHNGLAQRPGSPSNEHTPSTKFHARMVVGTGRPNRAPPRGTQCFGQLCVMITSSPLSGW